MHYSRCLHTPTLLLCYPSLTFYYKCVNKSYDTEYYATCILFVLPLSIVSYPNELYHRQN